MTSITQQGTHEEGVLVVAFQPEPKAAVLVWLQLVAQHGLPHAHCMKYIHTY